MSLHLMKSPVVNSYTQTETVVGERRSQVNSRAMKLMFLPLCWGRIVLTILIQELYKIGFGKAAPVPTRHATYLVLRSKEPVESVAHIKSSISFTRKHNLRLVIRNTGHDGAGRSSGPDSLQIDTHRMKEITYHHDFTPIGSVVSGEGPAVTVEAGVMLGDLYAQGAHHGYTVVGGECPTVGATGGFVLGGGVSSILSHTRGLAVDNVLEYEIVTASGDLVIANAHQNKDLFWALRGGGGATFGITTRVTVRAFPDVPICTEKFVLQGPYHEPTFWKHGVQPLLETLQSLNRKGIVGQFELTRPSEELAQTSLEVFFLERKKDYVPDDDIRQLKDKLSSSDGGNAIHHSVQSRCLPNLNSALRHAPDIYPPDYGVLFGSILISTSMFNSSKGPREISENFARFSLHPGDLLFTSNLGGRVSEIPERADSETSMHPGWRSSSQLLTYVRYVGGLSVERKESALFELTNVQMPHLYSLEPDFNVSYVNLPDPNQPGAPRIFWGKSYDYLLKLKQIWDPEEIFITRLGVGSENWDVEGMCKLNRGSIHRVNSLLPLDWLRY
ncbi:hypothetical protein N7507_001799 [Penicillium longicatenatum]|nr:hypothetical protein N7507_001799 [Penicillium longicatenatum]